MTVREPHENQFLWIYFEQNISIAIVGKNEKFHILNDEENARYVSAVEKRTAGGPSGGDGGAGTVSEPATIEDIDDPNDHDSGDPQVQVAMET